MANKSLSDSPPWSPSLRNTHASTIEDSRIMLRCYLPATAGHNLLLASELTIGRIPARLCPRPRSTPHPKRSAIVGKHRLAKITSLKFAKDTLESALDQLSQDIGAQIVIRGPDLQADGITKNQSFGIDLSNKPAEEILVEILHLANPDKTSPGTHDARQKLVYIIEQKPDKTVSNRRHHTRQGERTPSDTFRTAFRIEKP